MESIRKKLIRTRSRNCYKDPRFGIDKNDSKRPIPLTVAYEKRKITHELKLKNKCRDLALKTSAVITIRARIK